MTYNNLLNDYRSFKATTATISAKAHIGAQLVKLGEEVAFDVDALVSEVAERKIAQKAMWITANAAMIAEQAVIKAEKIAARKIKTINYYKEQLANIA